LIKKNDGSEKKKRVQRLAIKVISWGMIALILWGISRQVLKDWHQVNWDDLTPVYLFFIPALIAAFCANICIVAIFKLILGPFGICIPFKNAFRIQMVSQVGKYIPGKIGLVFTKVFECGKVGIPSSSAMAAATYELFLGVYFQFLICALTLPVFLKTVQWIDFSWAVAFLPAAVFGGCIFIPPVYQLIVNYFCRLTNRKPIHVKGTSRQWLFLFLLLFTLTIVNGMINYCVINIFFPVGKQHFLFITGATAWAFLLGMLNVAAPSGIGVREGVLVAFYSLIMPSPLALGAAAVSRIVAVLIEWCLIGLAFFIKPSLNNNES
jgi:uncharacterized membrane protein YbhN (UPF0104 family)